MGHHSSTMFLSKYYCFATCQAFQVYLVLIEVYQVKPVIHKRYPPSKDGYVTYQSNITVQMSTFVVQPDYYCVKIDIR